MKKNLRNTCAKAMALVMAAAMVVTVSPVSADAKAKKPKLSKTKVSIQKGKKTTIKVKNAKPKKTTWSVNKKGKSVVSLSKKKKTSVTIKGKKKGSAKVTAKIKVGKKTYTKTVKVTVKAAGSSTTSKAPAATTAAAGTNAPAATTAAAGGSNAPAATTPAAGGSNAPAATTPATGTSAPTEDVNVTEEPVETVDPNKTPAPPFVVTISEEMEAAGTKDKDDYRQDVDWSEPGQVTFTNVNGYNGGLMLNLQESGEPVDMSEYSYIEADVETWADGGDEVFLKSFTDSSSIWSNIDGGKFEGKLNEGRRTVRFDITDYKKARKSMAAVMISPKGDGSSDVQTALTVYNIRFVAEGWTDPAEETPGPDATEEPASGSAIVLTGDDLGEKATYMNGSGIGRYKEPAYLTVPYSQLKDAESIVMEVEKTAEDFDAIQLKATIGGLGDSSALYCKFYELTGAKIKEKYDSLESPNEELKDDTKIKLAVQTMAEGLTGKINIKSLTVDGETIDISDQDFADWDYAEEVEPATEYTSTAEVVLTGYDLTKYSELTVEYDCDDPACEVFADIGVNFWTPSQRQYTEEQGKIVVNLDEENTLDGADPAENSGKTKDYDSATTYGVYLRVSPDKELAVGKSVTITKLTLVPKEEAETPSEPAGTPDIGSDTPDGPKKVDLSTIQSANSTQNDDGSVTVKDVEKFLFPLETPVEPNKTLKVKLKASVGEAGFRSWLTNDSETTMAEPWKSTDQESIKAGETFEIEYELKNIEKEGTGDAKNLFFKGISYGTNIDEMTIYSIEISYAD